MQIIPLEPRDIIASSGDPDPEAEIESMSWREYWNILLPLFMSLLLGFSSCHDGDLPNPPERELVPASFSVEIEGDVETRLSFDDDNANVNFQFEPNDQIRLYDGCSEPHLLVYKTNKFEGSVCAAKDFAKYRAVYPASSSPSSYNIVTINATQTVNAGSFDKASAPMIADYNQGDNKLSFKRAFSLLKIKVPAGYSKIVVSNYSSPDKNYYLTGTAELAYNSEGISITKNSEKGKSSVTLVPASGKGGIYYMSILPCTLSGLQVACYNGDKISFKCKAAGSADKEIARTEGIILGDVTASDWTFTCEAVNIGCIFEEGGTNVNYYIADRNLGITAEKLDGTMYSQGGAVPSDNWGPGWILPSDNILEYWAGSRPNNASQHVTSSFSGGHYSMAKNSTSFVVSLPTQSVSGGYRGDYWGKNDSYLYISYSGTLDKSRKQNSSINAYIRPVFTVPAP